MSDTIPKPPAARAIHPMVVQSGVMRPDLDPTVPGQWTDGDLLLYIPDPTLKLEDDVVSPDTYPGVMTWTMSGWRKVFDESGKHVGWHFSLRPTVPRNWNLEFRLVGQPGAKFFFGPDLPRPG